jgi:tetratricopeptide (TPR) repeat protein
MLPKLSVAEAMFKAYESGGVVASIQRYRALKATNDTTYDFSESELNEPGYELLGMKRFDDAIEILKLNVEAYPASSNVYDGLGEAYMDNGDKELAMNNYKKSLQLDAGNSNAVQMLKKLGKE